MMSNDPWRLQLQVEELMGVQLRLYKEIDEWIKTCNYYKEAILQEKRNARGLKLINDTYRHHLKFCADLSDSKLDEIEESCIRLAGL